MRVEVLSSVTGELAEQLWDLYLGAFSPLAALAAARHLLTREELDAELVDPRIDKIVGFAEDGGPVGFFTRTRDASAVPWISGDAYRIRFPEQAATGRLYFLPILAIAPEFQGRGHGVRLVERAFAEPAAAGAVVAWDVAGANAEVQHIVARVVAIAHRLRPARLQVVDIQTYYALDFADPDDGLVVLSGDPRVVALDDGDNQMTGLDVNVSASESGTAESGGAGRA